LGNIIFLEKQAFEWDYELNNRCSEFKFLQNKIITLNNKS